jgi:hypothetical protein
MRSPNGEWLVRNLSKVLLIVALVAFALPGLSQTAFAHRTYDGPWTVTLVGDQGGCISSFYFGLRVVNGTLSASGGGFALVGRVSSKGAVWANVGSGDTTARAYGRLSRSVGYGRWTSPSRGCVGRWSARRT